MVNINQNIRKYIDPTEDITELIDSKILNSSGYAISDEDLRIIDDAEFGEDTGDGELKELNFDVI